MTNSQKQPFPEPDIDPPHSPTINTINNSNNNEIKNDLDVPRVSDANIPPLQSVETSSNTTTNNTSTSNNMNKRDHLVQKLHININQKCLMSGLQQPYCLTRVPIKYNSKK